MSEIKIEDFAEVVKSHVDEAIASVDAKIEAAVEGAKSEAPSVEGFAKSEELESALEAVKSVSEELAAEKAAREELEAVVKAAPAIVKSEESVMHSFKWDSESINAKSNVDLGGEITKAFNGTTQVTGEPTSSARLYYQLQQTNPFRTAGATVMPMNSSTMELPTVTGITAAHEANLPGSINTASGHGGDLATTQLITQNWTSRSYFSDQSVEDLPGLDSMVGGFMGQQIGVAEAADMVAQIKASVNAAAFVTSNAGRRVTTTGGAISLANFIDVKQAVAAPYRAAGKYMVGREIYARLRTLSQSGSGSDLVWDPVQGEMTLFGRPVIVNDHFENFGAANNLLAVYGDFSRAFIIGNRKSMSISRHEDTIPGGVYYYGNMRSRGQVWDAQAFGAIRSNA